MMERRSSRRLIAFQVRVYDWIAALTEEYKLRIDLIFFAEVAIGKTRLASMEFEGTIFVACCIDDDWIGSVFSFQV